MPFALWKFGNLVDQFLGNVFVEICANFYQQVTDIFVNIFLHNNYPPLSKRLFTFIHKWQKKIIRSCPTSPQI